MGKAVHAVGPDFLSYVEYDFAGVDECWLQWRQAWNQSALEDFALGEVFLRTSGSGGNIIDTIWVFSGDPDAPQLITWNSINGTFGPVLVALSWYTVGLHVTITGGVIETELYLNGVNIGPVDNGGATALGQIDGITIGGWELGGAGDEMWVANITLGTSGFGSTDIFAAEFESGVFVPPFTVDHSTDGDLLEIVDDRSFFLPRPIVRYGGSPSWRLIVTNLAGETLTTLDKRAKDRAFLFSLNAPATHTGLVPSDDPEINIPSPDPDSPAFVSHNTRLVYGLRRERRHGTSPEPWLCRFGGILMTTEDVAADAPTTRYTAYDPWQYLMARPALNPDSTFPTSAGIRYTDARASDIAVELLANTIAVNGDVFIDASDVGLIEDTDVIDGLTKFDQGLSVGEAWQQLCDTGTIDIVLNPIYDPIGRPGKLCELVISKQAGQVRYDAVFGWDRAGRNLTELSRLIDGTRLANKIKMFTGSGKGIPFQTDPDSVSTYGEYWSQQFSLGKQEQVSFALLLALAQLQIRKNGGRTITFTPAPELSPLALLDYELGDYVALWASRAFREPLGIDYDSLAALAVSISGPPTEGETLTAEITDETATAGGVGYQRVFAIPITLDDDGVERVEGILTASDTASD